MSWRAHLLTSHNERGPHDTRFYRLLEELVARFNTAERLGYLPGIGFLLPGQRLGGKAAPQTLFERREAAAAAAGKRTGLTCGAYRLGGAREARSLRELAAEVRILLTGCRSAH